MRKLLAIVLLAIAGSALGQSGNFPALVGQRGTTLPTNCTIGQLFFDTDATAGGNIYGCTAANTWTQMEGGSAITGCTYAANVLTCPTITATTQFIAPAGSAATPSLLLSGPSAPGLFNNGGLLGITIAGTNRAGFGTGALAFTSAYALSWSDALITRYAAKQLMISGDGTGATTNAGIIAGYSGTSGSGLIDNSTAGALRIGTSLATSIIMGSGSIEVLPGADNGLKLGSNSFRWRDLFISGQIRAGNAGGYMAFADVAGAGPSITAGTAKTAVSPLSITQTWNESGVAFPGITLNVTNTASAAGSTLFDLQIASVSAFKVTKASLVLGSAIVSPAGSGTRYICIDTSGVISSSASACSGT